MQVGSDCVPKKKYEWIEPKTVQIPVELTQALQAEQLPEVLAPILYTRGIQTKQALQEFLYPAITSLHDPFLLHDMERVVDRIQQALVEEEAILIYGDYDADGITSTTVLKEALELLGANVSTYLPNRFTDGYGPNRRVYEEQIKSGIQLIITVDNGVSGHEAIAYAKSQDVDVIVTDHHELPEQLPEAYAIIHPKHPQGAYPFKELAGVGVAFKLVCALLEEVVYEALDLVAIGTVADMVSLTGENRVLVSQGINALKHTQRLGLLELLKVSQVDAAAISGETIGFSLAPRLNALGRLADANEAVTLLSTFDLEEATRLSQELDDWNTKRKGLVEEVMIEAMQQLDHTRQVNVLIGDQWHEGVLGIVAGRIMQETAKPTIVLTRLASGAVKGSGRSIPQIDLFRLLSQWKENYISFGGHHSAIGITLDEAYIDTLVQQMDTYLAEQIQDIKGVPLTIAASLTLSQVDLTLVDAIDRLAPFGMDNALPLFKFEQVKLEHLAAIGAKKNHLKGVMLQEGHELDMIAFQMGDALDSLQADNLSFVGKLTINEWNGRKKVQLQVEDYATTGVQFYDYRTKKRLLPKMEEATYLSFTTSTSAFKKTLSHVVELTSEQMVKEWVETTPAVNNMVFIDCPLSLEWLHLIYQENLTQHYYLVFETEDDAYLDGVGTREQYARLFALIKQGQAIDVRYRLQDIAKYLNLPPKLLIFMIQVFFELKFVTIDDGVLSYVSDAPHRALNESVLYQERQLKMDSQSFLQLTNLENLKQWFFS